MRGTILLDVRPAYPGVLGTDGPTPAETVFVVYQGQDVYYRSTVKLVTYGKVNG